MDQDNARLTNELYLGHDESKALETESEDGVGNSWSVRHYLYRSAHLWLFVIVL